MKRRTQDSVSIFHHMMEWVGGRLALKDFQNKK